MPCCVGGYGRSIVTGHIDDNESRRGCGQVQLLVL